MLSMLAPPLAGCREEPIHASLLADAITPTPQHMEVSPTHWTAFLKADLPWISADTQINMVFDEQTGDTFRAQMYHKEGYLIVGGVEVPPDSTLTLDGLVLTRPTPPRIRLEVEDYDHVLVLDADLFALEHLEGYFVLDDQYEVWVEFTEGWIYW